MSYRRKTHTAAELSEALRRAALSRKMRRGGRPPLDDVPERAASVRGRDYEIFKGLAAKRGTTVKAVLHLFAALVVKGGEISAKPELAPDGWKFCG